MKRNQLGQFTKGSSGKTFEGFGVWLDRKGYPSIWIDGKSVKIHVLVWERVHGRKPKGYDVHHKDFDRGNFSLGNLQLLTKSDHAKVHAHWIQEDGEWVAKPCTKCGRVFPLSNFYVRKGYTPSPLCKPCHNLATTQRNNTIPEKRKIYNQRWYAKRKGVMQNAKGD